MWLSVPGLSMRTVRSARNSLHSSLLTVSLESRLPEPSLSCWRRTTFLLPICVVKAMMGLATAPLATYEHCSGHCLNLVIAKSCALPIARCMINHLQHCCRYFLNSPKCSGALELVVSHNVPGAVRRKPLLDLCKTRWAEQHSAYQHF